MYLVLLDFTVSKVRIIRLSDSEVYQIENCSDDPAISAMGDKYNIDVHNCQWMIINRLDDITVDNNL